MNNSPINTASLSWNELGTPISEQFGDIYFSNQDGLEETRHVFLQGNHFPLRFGTHVRSECVIAETGFGTGLNFLTLWQAFEQFRQTSPNACLKRLHYVSFEKFPLTKNDLQSAHCHWPELEKYSKALCSQWPLPIAGCHRIILADGAITLDLWFGDINTLLPQTRQALRNKVDAWFLDGFAPSKNPQMWSETLFQSMADSMRENGTFSTFTAAGIVKRGLQSVGFEIKKIKGFGQKREMLTGVFPHSPSPEYLPYYARPHATQAQDIAIIGGGIASTFIALSCLRRGAKVTLYCEDKQPATNASGNRQGVLYPLLNGKSDEIEQFFTTAFLFARRAYDNLSQAGIMFSHQWSGVAQLIYNDRVRKKAERIINHSASFHEIACYLSQDEINTQCGLDINYEGLFYPQAGWLSPTELTTQALKHAQQLGLTLHFNHQVTQIMQHDSSWSLNIVHHNDNHVTQIQSQHDCVILANGHRITDFTQSAKLPISAVRGQVSHIPTTKTLSKLKTVLCYDGYFTPVDNQDHLHCVGASFRRDRLDLTVSSEEQEDNQYHLTHCLAKTPWCFDVDFSQNNARVGIRCTIRDHLPLLGEVPDFENLLLAYTHLDRFKRRRQTPVLAPAYHQLYIISALGSRGLCSAPLSAEILASQIFDEPFPVEDSVLNALHPNRFWVRPLLRGKPIEVKK
ncbi:bifunctional tRNA (5-methylaminomethyl-2-thiouridine)(34)-methyltransferase MnmD/FAD-dependent 5-carboxymethylaminomethyl-2-thiouridine(34) oxidoreductase MnmC [Proteus vulgaris]|uniref:bifunctional tRNA (5-methylaminomethyl-2-thiouridine)(34)-methyltransferase MnmD/FAD-dependent 5-carboxymethylaminomethyl-2-thiouridine(34) oxidoreductase MnmC n=1 Tax=Proteus TaxID=583 RepID=UPI000D69C67F|nr:MULTISPECIES: bifunctional tRNA (5-methylaminomethyl-2-thiouridine)(34)-methyltransferase MnmD/FAD-dependent 5-carboxymethylaminomethyl-2-thiouridine(34) oxidoreductase MnmC [Proteus]MDS0789152.1 bifunctional tRNA (5-methylaminomethyl-2-thiouridine)(34)-methyltransferase MnmD/FAD-dependent 5-carboxymethylaminomethyl-2-thiouridine(34) oxidoreductase MnmC [Proteus vulgaris]